MIDIVTYHRKPMKPRRPKIQLPLDEVVGTLDRLSAYTREPRDVAEFAALLRAMGPEAATEYLTSHPPMAAWVERLLSQMHEDCRVIGTGFGVAMLALQGKAVMT